MDIKLQENAELTKDYNQLKKPFITKGNAAKTVCVSCNRTLEKDGEKKAPSTETKSVNISMPDIHSLSYNAQK